MPNEVSAVTRTYDYTLWLLPHIAGFTRQHRFTLGNRLEEGAVDNLLLAAGKARSGKRFLAAPALFHHNLEKELIRLQEELEAESYRPGPYRTFRINDPKPRIISAAPFRDRVAHHAVCNLVEPIF